MWGSVVWEWVCYVGGCGESVVWECVSCEGVWLWGRMVRVKNMIILFLVDEQIYLMTYS